MTVFISPEMVAAKRNKTYNRVLYLVISTVLYGYRRHELVQSIFVLRQTLLSNDSADIMTD